MEKDDYKELGNEVIDSLLNEYACIEAGCLWSQKIIIAEIEDFKGLIVPPLFVTHEDEDIAELFFVNP